MLKMSYDAKSDYFKPGDQHPHLETILKQAGNDCLPFDFSCSTVTITTTTNYDIGIGFLRLQSSSYCTCHHKRLCESSFPLSPLHRWVASFITMERGEVQVHTIWWHSGLGFVDGYPLNFHPQTRWKSAWCTVRVVVTRLSTDHHRPPWNLEV